MKKLFQNFLLLSLIITGNVACFQNFYKTTNANGSSVIQRAKTIDSLETKQKDFILRAGGNSYYMNAMNLSDDQKTLSCKLDTVPDNHQLHLTGRRGHSMRYKKPKDEDVLTEVHIYIPSDNLIKYGSYNIPLENIQKIEVIQKDRGRTTANHVISTVGVTVATAVVAVLIVAATSSCPYISTYDGNKFSIQGEAYGGAIYPQLAKDDYMPVQMHPSADGNLQLKISNELPEKQHTDLADLIMITHDKNTKVLSDEKGNFYEVLQPQAPVTAILSNQNNVTEALQKQNDGHVLYFDDTLAQNATNNVTLQFNKQAGAKKAKLVLSLKNSFWLDHLYGELVKGFGTYYNTYIKKQSQKPAAELTKWIKEQQIPLEVSLKTSSGWKVISDINTIGPAVTREMIVPIDLSAIEGDYTEIKLSSGFMFWEIDYTAIDYSADKNISVETISPSSATDETGSNVLPRLIKTDNVYLEQLVPGNVTTVEYKYKPLTDAGKIHSFILHTKGYYTHIRNFNNKPDIGFLKQFKNPNALPGLSLTLYKEFRNATFNTFTKN